MPCTCVRQTDLPNTSAIAADVFYHPDRTAAFYRHPLRDLASFRAAAAEIDFPAGRRAALVAALGPRNPSSRSLQRLAEPGAVAVVTGQQVGLFSGPSYTAYKALHAARLAAWLTEQGVPAVPIFWLATQDHDFAEVNHTWVFDKSNRPHKLEMRRQASSQPVGDIALAAPPIDELRAALSGLPFADEVTAHAAAAYQPGNTMGRAFGDLLQSLFAKFDILQVDPLLPAFRQLAAPVLRSAVAAAPDLSAAILARNQELASAGYHAQVHMEEQTSLFFLMENGKRLALRRHGSEYVLNGRRFSSQELQASAESLSPNALLRPVVQDSILPTAASIMGPAEMAYLAQSEVIYRAILGRMPVAVPRAGFTILDQHSHKLLDRYGLRLTDFFDGEEAIRHRVADRLVPPALAGSLRETAAAVSRAVDDLRSQLVAFDPTLAQALDRSARKIRYQIGKVEGKAGRETMRRDARATEDAASLSGLLWPERHLQERLYSILPFLARHGLGLLDQVYEAIQLDCPDHRMMVI
jgi:bacillithiol biosynthesis cysteine-adding enzyme BshC